MFGGVDVAPETYGKIIVPLLFLRNNELWRLSRSISSLFFREPRGGQAAISHFDDMSRRWAQLASPLGMSRRCAGSLCSRNRMPENVPKCELCLDHQSVKNKVPADFIFNPLKISHSFLVVLAHKFGKNGTLLGVRSYLRRHLPNHQSSNLNLQSQIFNLKSPTSP